MNFIPKYILQNIDYKKGELVESQDYNNILNLLITASDNNTEALNKLFYDEAIKWVLNAIHADEADLATMAEDSKLLQGSPVSRFAATPLEDNDNKIPTSKQVKEYIDNLDNETTLAFTQVNSDLQNIKTKNIEQDNRLANIDNTVALHTTRLSSLDNGLARVNTEIDSIKKTDIAQNSTLADHNQRITNLELGEVPDDVIKTLMIKANYAMATGEGQYSENIVATANTALNLTVDGIITPANSFVSKTAFNELNSKSFITRGILPDPAGEFYSVGEMKSLQHGSYEVTSTNASKLLGINNAGTLRSYPCTNGVSLEFEIQTGPETGSFSTLFIPASTTDSEFVSQDWYNSKEVHNQLQAAIDFLATTKLDLDKLEGGNDIAITQTADNRIVNYTGPKIVISEEQPVADPARITLWIKL